MERLEINIDVRRVANLLKDLINHECETPLYADIGDMPHIFDINRAIDILEEAEPYTITIAD